MTDCKLEPSLAEAASPDGVPLAAGLPVHSSDDTGRQAASGTPEVRYQFERNGYFCPDPDSTADKLVFNRTVTLRDTWAKMAKKN